MHAFHIHICEEASCWLKNIDNAPSKCVARDFIWNRSDSSSDDFVAWQRQRSMRPRMAASGVRRSRLMLANTMDSWEFFDSARLVASSVEKELHGAQFRRLHLRWGRGWRSSQPCQRMLPAQLVMLVPHGCDCQLDPKCYFEATPWQTTVYFSKIPLELQNHDTPHKWCSHG